MLLVLVGRNAPRVGHVDRLGRPVRHGNVGRFANGTIPCGAPRLQLLLALLMFSAGHRVTEHRQEVPFINALEPLPVAQDKLGLVQHGPSRACAVIGFVGLEHIQLIVADTSQTSRPSNNGLGQRIARALDRGQNLIGIEDRTGGTVGLCILVHWSVRQEPQLRIQLEVVVA